MLRYRRHFENTNRRRKTFNFAQNILSYWNVPVMVHCIFSTGSRLRKIRLLSIPFCLFIVVIIISILQVDFDKFQSSANYWWKFYSDRTRKKNTFKTIEKHRYGIWKTVSKHLKLGRFVFSLQTTWYSLENFFIHEKIIHWHTRDFLQALSRL